MNRTDLPAGHRLIDRILELLDLLSPLVGREDPAGRGDAVRLALVDQLDHNRTHTPDLLSMSIHWERAIRQASKRCALVKPLDVGVGLLAELVNPAGDDANEVFRDFAQVFDILSILFHCLPAHCELSPRPKKENVDEDAPSRGRRTSSETWLRVLPMGCLQRA